LPEDPLSPDPLVREPLLRDPISSDPLPPDPLSPDSPRPGSLSPRSLSPLSLPRRSPLPGSRALAAWSATTDDVPDDSPLSEAPTTFSRPPAAVPFDPFGPAPDQPAAALPPSLPVQPSSSVQSSSSAQPSPSVQSSPSAQAQAQAPASASASDPLPVRGAQSASWSRPLLPPAQLQAGSVLAEQADPRGRPGRLFVDDGMDVLVDRDCVIGRNPEVDPDVARGLAKGVQLQDVEQRISRVHARLVLDDGDASIVDEGSVNGTWIEPPGSEGWIAVLPDVPTHLPLGSRIQVGDVVLAYAADPALS